MRLTNNMVHGSDVSSLRLSFGVRVDPRLFLFVPLLDRKCAFTIEIFIFIL